VVVATAMKKNATITGLNILGLRFNDPALKNRNH